MARLELVINKLVTKKGLSVSVAESCTGGLVSSLITNVKGSSEYFPLGLIAYNNRVKASLLKIPVSLILKHGAASERIARLMASAVRTLGKTDIGIGITGIAGPSGGSKEKPVGTVFIAIEGVKKKICQRFQFKGTRLAIKKKAAHKALELLVTCLTKS